MIKMNLAMLANRKTKAEKYSAKVRAERDELLGLVKAVIVGFALLIAAGVAGTVTDMPMETKAKERETYLICDVENCYNTDFNGNTYLYCEMPNGELEVFSIKDAPEGKCELVTFKTKNLDDYTTYEVVAVR